MYKLLGDKMKKKLNEKEKQFQERLLDMLANHFSEDEDRMMEDEDRMMEDMMEDEDCIMEDMMEDKDGKLNKEKRKQLAIIVIGKKAGKKI